MPEPGRAAESAAGRGCRPRRTTAHALSPFSGTALPHRCVVTNSTVSPNGRPASVAASCWSSTIPPSLFPASRRASGKTCGTRTGSAAARQPTKPAPARIVPRRPTRCCVPDANGAVATGEAAATTASAFATRARDLLRGGPQSRRGPLPVRVARCGLWSRSIVRNEVADEEPPFGAEQTPTETRSTNTRTVVRSGRGGAKELEDERRVTGRGTRWTIWPSCNSTMRSQRPATPGSWVANSRARKPSCSRRASIRSSTRAGGVGVEVPGRCRRRARQRRAAARAGSARKSLPTLCFGPRELARRR